ncbi:sulfotransferase family protein [Seongchinamella sediminis]|uniref:Sulfotransferase family protein n=1 Tax=Seongchinamella sediminis TaxID=2283635 RepID=A0A3L7DT80_9GAMM|nr:sulfotransferase [Seongchinamella sediminis]RLQ20758.1 sulfotransferase family protein [Seongchinamella sediminis]
MASYRLEEWLRRLFVMRKTVGQALSAGRNRAGQHVAFIAGVQRSGTNMMMDVLERSAETDVYHERDRRAFDNYQMRQPAVIHSLLRRSRGRCFVIKSLCELQHLQRLMEEFTPARTVWIVRDYRDVVNSMCKSFGNQGKQVKRIAVDRDADGWQGQGMSDATHALVRDHVHDAISDPSAAALIWYFRNQLYFDQGLDGDPRVLLVRYESLVTQPEPEFRRIFAFLDLAYRRGHSRKVVPHSIRKAREPDIEQPIRDLCEAMMGRFDGLRPLTGELAS